MSLIGTPELLTIAPLVNIIEKQLIPSIQQGEVLLVADDALAAAISSRFGLQCLSGETSMDVNEVFRAIRSHMRSLLGTSSLQTAELPTVSSMAQVLVLMKMADNGVGASGFCSASVRLLASDALFRWFGLVDVISQLDLEMDTKFNNLREWYGWHFPELAKIVADPLTYCRIVRNFGAFFPAENNDTFFSVISNF